MTASNIEQTVALDSYPDTPLDQFPDILNRQVIAEVGLDGINDAMELEFEGPSFSPAPRTPDSTFAAHSRSVGTAFVVQDRGDATWTKIA